MIIGEIIVHLMVKVQNN